VPTGRVADPYKRTPERCAVEAVAAREIAVHLRRLAARGAELELGRTAGRRTWRRLETSADILDRLADWDEELVALIEDGQCWIGGRNGRRWLESVW
jgi:hypothetical protein